MMRVLLPALAAGVCLAAAACSGASSDRTVIAGSCARDGGVQSTCDCLARESVKRFEKPSLEAVVLGAQGQDAEADKIMASLTADESARFRMALVDIVAACKADDYVQLP